MDIIAVTNQKGGPGKTTSTLNIAGCLACYHKKKVVVIDCDAQCNLTMIMSTPYVETFSNGEERRFKKCEEFDEDFENESYRTINTGVEIKTLKGLPYTVEYGFIDYRTKDYKQHYSIDFIAGYSDLDEYNELDVDFLKEILDTIKDEYDYAILDMHPTRAGITSAALVAADYAIIPCEPTRSSLSGMVALISDANFYIENGYSNVNVLGMFYTKYDKQQQIQDFNIQQYGNEFEELDLVFNTKIRFSKLVEESSSMGMPFCTYDSKRNIAVDYKNLTDEILAKIEKHKQS